MPIYEYHCLDCGTFAAQRTMAQRNDAGACPYCGGAASRIIASPPVLGSLSQQNRVAHTRNERAAHEPKRSSQHGMSCACCKPVKMPGASASPTTTRAAAGRPWMISH